MLLQSAVRFKMVACGDTQDTCRHLQSNFVSATEFSVTSGDQMKNSVVGIESFHSVDCALNYLNRVFRPLDVQTPIFDHSGRDIIARPVPIQLAETEICSPCIVLSCTSQAIFLEGRSVEISFANFMVN